MKKIFILPVCLMSMGALASTTFYYETTGQCGANGLFLNTDATDCSQMVTRITPPTFPSGKKFLGYYAGTTRVIDNNGNILIGGARASTLFNQTYSEDKKAEPSVGSDGQIEVFKHTIWRGDSTTSPWYYCSGVQRQYCDENGYFFVPYAPHCWGAAGNPSQGKYDFAFNSWGFPDATFSPASSTWVDCLPCLFGSSGCNSSCVNNVSFGNMAIESGCNAQKLGAVLENGAKISQWKVFPFACKKIYDTTNAEWKEVIRVDNGRIALNNKTLGKCTYELICDNGYNVTDTASATITCSGAGCKGFFDGNVSTLGSLGLTATCVPTLY